MPSKSAKVSSLSEKFKRDMFGLASNLPKVLELDLAKLERNPDQPRKAFDESALRELADSILSHGLLQPITVQAIPDTDRFMVVAGERRFRAHQLAGKDTIFAITTTGNPDELALIENIQRENLDPLEEAEAYARLKERYGYTQTTLGKAVGKAQNTVSELLSLNNLPDAIKAEYRTSDIAHRPSKSVLVEIARLPGTAQQLTLWSQIKTGSGGTVRAARERRATGATLSDRAKRFQAVVSAGHRFTKLVQNLSGLSPTQHEELETILRVVRDAVRKHVSGK